MSITIRPAGPATAADAAGCARVADFTNAAYAIGEAGMWRAGTARTTPAEIAALAAGDELLVAEADGAPVGCVRVRPLDGATWGLGMLAVDPGVQGGGAGGALIDAAEQAALAAGAAEMQLELLVPTGARQASKVRLEGWYAARGYRRTSRDRLEDHHPELVPLLAVACTYDVWRKPLSV